jgi:hypothetical protein
MISNVNDDYWTELSDSLKENIKEKGLKCIKIQEVF